jgi:serine/threonine protein kinase
MHENFFDDYFCYMVMERCKYGLVSYLKILPTITESTLVPVFHQMLQGLTHLHSLNIIHRDVKPENFLVGGRDGQTVKLADFGLAAIVPESGKVAKVCGTAAYMCPEMILLREADFKADIWSLGVTAYLASTLK